MSHVILIETLSFVHCLGLSDTEQGAINVVNHWIVSQNDQERFTKTFFERGDLLCVDHFKCFNEKYTFDLTNVSIKKIQHLRCFKPPHNSNIVILEI